MVSWDDILNGIQDIFEYEHMVENVQISCLSKFKSSESGETEFKISAVNKIYIFILGFIYFQKV